MAINKLEKIYTWIYNLGPNVKTVIIIILSLFIFTFLTGEYTNSILNKYATNLKADKKLSEEYTKIITPYINKYCEDILLADKDISNLILLNYHNTLVSSHGLSYRYLTPLIEKKRGFETNSCIKIWKELEYTNYGDEIEEINANRYLRMDSIERYKYKLPNAIELLRLSEAKSAAFYPLIGINGPIGMLVIIYKTKKLYNLGYYQNTISPALLPLTTLLDYDEVKEKFKQLYESGQAEPECLL